MRTDGHLYRSLFGYNFYDIGWISISMFTMINGYQPAIGPPYPTIQDDMPRCKDI